MNIDDCDKKYTNDPAFHACVKHIYAMIDEMHLTPGEARDAAMYAHYLHEMRNPLPMYLTFRERHT